MTDDDPVTLSQACQEVFHGCITPHTLRAEARRGNLRIFRIGKRDFVTLREVRELCAKSRPVYTGERAIERGSSETVPNISERVAMLQSELRQRSN